MTSGNNSLSLAYIATHEDVVYDVNVFRHTFNSLHAALGTRINIPVIGGNQLNLHQLYIEVTRRGGFEKVVKEKKWREVSTVFNFPPTTTSASHVLKKNYFLLLKDLEKIYFFNQRGSPVTQPSPVTSDPPAVEGQESVSNPLGTGQEEENGGSKSGTVMVKVIGKFEDGYYAVVRRGLNTHFAVLYHPADFNSTPPAPTKNVELVPYNNPVPPYNPSPTNTPAVPSNGKRRKRNRRQRDPGHPRPNRSAYNFFFSAKHTEFKSTSSLKQRNFTKMIGEAWNNLSDEERKVYQDIGQKDKERYQKELQDYNKRKALLME